MQIKVMKKIWMLTLLMWMAVGCQTIAHKDAEVSVIPQPQRMETNHAESFMLSQETSVMVDSELDASILSRAFHEITEPILTKSPAVTPQSGAKAGLFRFVKSEDLEEEAYRLTIDKRGVEIASKSTSGAFYALQTMRQLMPTMQSKAKVDVVELPCVKIEDAPRLKYRGFMIDVARHFFQVDEVKTMIDIMALHKLNRLHLHLTDDQGWRIEIKRYPKLTSVGSIRKRTIIGKDPNGEYDETTPFDETPYGGFYTQDDIREIVAYAHQHCIEVIPEIEFTGHAVSALASYPWLSCTQEEYEVRQTWDIDDRVYCVGRETTFEFMENVLEEVISLFPSEYIHIGGDECPTKMWAKCDKCQALMKRLGLKTERQLQGYATVRMEKFIQKHGRRMMELVP